MKILSLFLFIFMFANTSFAEEVDPCVKLRSEQRNNWILTLNQKDSSSREQLLSTLRLLATQGFTPEFIVAPPQDAHIALVFTFNPDLFRSPEIAEQTKNETLRALIEIGNSVECNDLTRQGMGIRN